MSKVVIEESSLSGIASAIRDKLSVSTTYKPSQMAAAIMSIEGYPEPTGSIGISSNGTVDVKDFAQAVVSVSGDNTGDANLQSGDQMLSGVTAYARGSKYVGTIDTYAGSVNGGAGSIGSYTLYSGAYVATPSTISQSFPTANTVMTQDFVVGSYSAVEPPALGSLSISSNGTYIASDSQLDGFSRVVVSVPASGITPSGSLSISQNGTYDVTSFAGAVVDVSASAVMSSVSISANGTYTAAATGVDGFDTVVVSVPVSASLISETFISNGTYTASEFADGWNEITISVAPKVRAVNIAASGTYKASEMGFDGFAQVTINIIDQSTFSSIVSVPESAYVKTIGLQSLELPVAETIGQDAFQSCYDLSYVSAPVCTTIMSGAFSGCGLQVGYFPECTSIGNFAFSNCNSLSELYIPKYSNFNSSTMRWVPLQTLTVGVTSVPDDDMFAGNSRITTLALPECTSIGQSALKGLRSLASVSVPKCVTIGVSAFGNISTLTSIDLPSCTTISSYAFQSCWALSVASLPKVRYIGKDAFFACSTLSVVSLPDIRSIDGDAFDGTYLKSLYLLGSNYCQPNDARPILPGSGVTVYVLSSLYASYYTGWSYLWTALSMSLVSI